MGIIEFIASVLICIAIVFDIEMFGWVAISIWLIIEIIAIIRSIIYSKKTFVCMNCGKEFKLKWTYLLRTYMTWGSFGKKESIEVDNESYKILWVRCNNCGTLKARYK